MGNHYRSRECNEPEKAIEYYKKAIELDENNSVAWSNIGDALFNMKRYEEAIPYFEKALEIWPKGGTQEELGWCLMEAKRFERAIEVFKHQISIAPSDYCFIKMGFCYLELGKDREALACASEAIGMWPNESHPSREAHARAWFVRGKAHLNLGDPEEALKDFDAALSFDPSFAEAFEARMKVRSGASVGKGEGR